MFNLAFSCVSGHLVSSGNASEAAACSTVYKLLIKVDTWEPRRADEDLNVLLSRTATDTSQRVDFLSRSAAKTTAQSRWFVVMPAHKLLG